MSYHQKSEMQKLIEEEIDVMESGLKKYARSKLIPLQLKVLKWEHGNDEEFPSWLFADFGERNVGAAYCLDGHGASGDSWGLIFLNDDYFGMDGGWYTSFRELLTDGWYFGMKKAFNKKLQRTICSAFRLATPSLTSL